MSFCPHCGKSVAEQAAKCIACGGELQPRGKGARFKGTMMMQPGAAPVAPAPPAPAPAPAPAIAKPAPAPVAEAQRAIAPSPSKAKHTMLGTGVGGLGLAPPPGVKPALAPAPLAPPPAAGPSSLPPAPPPSPPAPHAPHAMDPALADTGRNPTPVPSFDPPPSYDPPAPENRPVPHRPAAPRLDQESDPPVAVPGRKGGPIVALAIVGVMLLLTLLYLVARFLGLA